MVLVDGKMALVDGMNQVCATFPVFVSLAAFMGIPALSKIGAENVWATGRGGKGKTPGIVAWVPPLSSSLLWLLLLLLLINIGVVN